MVLNSAAPAQDWLDDFNDGSAVDGAPVTWTATPAFAVDFAVDAGDLVVGMPDGAFPPISSLRVPSNFTSGASVRARMVAFNGPGRFAVALADEPTGIQGYVASFSTCGGGRIELFRGDVLGSIVFLCGGPVPWPYSPLDEHYIQLDVFGGVISARVWRPGEPFPAPQISCVDTFYTEGVASIAIQDFGTGNCTPSGDFSDVSAVARFAQASSTPLTHSGLGDVDADGQVGVIDFLSLLASWGPCPGPCPPPSCPADVAPPGGDCTVDVQDLLALLGNWG
jgi:hypothetical protein